MGQRHEAQANIITVIRNSIVLYVQCLEPASGHADEQSIDPTWSKEFLTNFVASNGTDATNYCEPFVIHALVTLALPVSVNIDISCGT
jgi:hypothetical protein